MELVIIGHFAGDFYFQTDKMAKKKKTSISYMLLHCAIYATVVGIAVFLQMGFVRKCLCPIVIMFISHIVVDKLKIIIEKKWIKTERDKCWLFLGDQFVHIVILTLVCMCNHIYLSDASIIRQNSIVCMQSIVVAIGGIICGKPAAIIVSKVLAAISEDTANAQNRVENDENEVVGVGAWIGMLEREVIFLLGLLGQFSAIGFVLTAKSVARYKQLENKAFAEKYLIGTLLSAFIALVCVSVCSYTLQ